MKKILLALTIVALVASTASAIEVLGGKLGVGAEQLNLDGAALNPFVSLDLNAIPVQLRLSAQVVNTPKVQAGNDYPDSTTRMSFSALYSLWGGNWAPYVGGRLGWANVMANQGEDVGQLRSVTTSLSILAGLKWMILSNVNFYIEMDALALNTKVNSVDGKDVTCFPTTQTTWFGDTARLGAVVTL